jgi:hypothetical protein
VHRSCCRLSVRYHLETASEELRGRSCPRSFATLRPDSSEIFHTTAMEAKDGNGHHLVWMKLRIACPMAMVMDVSRDEYFLCAVMFVDIRSNEPMAAGVAKSCSCKNVGHTVAQHYFMTRRCSEMMPELIISSEGDVCRAHSLYVSHTRKCFQKCCTNAAQ